MSEITRDGIERALVEFTGFKGDQAVVDALMVIIDAYAASQIDWLSTSAGAVVEAHYHLLTQQAELLLDSGGRLASAERLAEHVTFLSGLTDGMQRRMKELADSVMGLAWLAERSAEETQSVENLATEVRYLRGSVLAAEALFAEEVADEEEIRHQEELAGSDLRESLPDPASGFEDLHKTRNELLTEEAQEPHFRQEAIDESLRILAELKSNQAGKQPRRSLRPKRRHAMPYKGEGGIMYLHCQGDCGLDRPVTDFFRNGKSPSGYESKCHECRKARALA